MFSTIVVGTDGSETATAAVSKAIELAKQSDATLHVVNAARLVSISHVASAAAAGAPTFDVENVNRGIEAEGKAICDHAVGQSQQADVKCETHVVSGDPADALISVAETVGADLIVVGNRGMTGARRFVLGSVPNKVAHHAPCSILIVDTSK
jgi:nucleotide-binding universal stress UspA family protein